MAAFDHDELRFGADYRDPSPRDADGTVLVAITAMDALDFRGEDSSLRRQLQVWMGVGLGLDVQIVSNIGLKV